MELTRDQIERFRAVAAETTEAICGHGDLTRCATTLVGLVNVLILPAASTSEHRTADGYEIHEGDQLWDNNLALVTVTKVASYSEKNQNKSHPAFGQLTWWHDTTGGMADGSRLAKFHPFTGKDAAKA